MTPKVFSPANYIKHWAHEKPNACFLKQPVGNRWQSTSWAEAFDKIARLATFLKKYPQNTKVGIYSNNCRDWFLADMAILAAGLVSVPTDGVVEAKSPSGELFGEARLLLALQSSDGGPKAIKNAVLKAVKQHVQGELTHDDVTFTAVRIHGDTL